MGEPMSTNLDSSRLNARLDQLVNGMVGLRDDGKFSEPNLDGTAGDYISFDGWEWPQGVGLYGLTQLWQYREHDATLENLLTSWFDRAIDQGLPQLNVNTTAPLLALSRLWAHTRHERYKKILDDWSNRLMTVAPRTGYGGIQHDVSDKINRSELWDDTLFMVALFLASYGQSSGRRELVDEAERQFLVHTHFLADRSSGLWFHGWTFEGRHNFASALWARGNAWITTGVLDLFELAELSPSVKAFLQDVLTDQAEALLAHQQPTGMWNTLLNEPTSYLETSATAGFAYGLLKGARIGLGDDRWRAAGLRALAAVESQIDADGVVGNVSYGTRMGHDLQHYRDIPIQPTGYGQSLTILALAEGVRALQKEEKPCQ